MSEDKVDLLAEALRAKAGQTGGVATPMAPRSTAKTDRILAEPMSLTPGWILLLAVLLGLATGTVIGLLTVL